MNIEFEKTIDDLIDFNLFHMAHSSSIIQRLTSARIYTGILTALLALFVGYFAYHKLNTPVLIISILVGAIAYAIYPHAIRKSLIRNIKKMLAEGDNKTTLGHQAISFSPEGLSIKGQNFDSKVTWSAIDKVTQSDKCFFLYTSSVDAVVIPKKCFRSEKEKQDFWNYINQYAESLIYV